MWDWTFHLVGKIVVLAFGLFILLFGIYFLVMRLTKAPKTVVAADKMPRLTPIPIPSKTAFF